MARRRRRRRSGQEDEARPGRRPIRRPRDEAEEESDNYDEYEDDEEEEQPRSRRRGRGGGESTRQEGNVLDRIRRRAKMQRSNTGIRDLQRMKFKEDESYQLVIMIGTGDQAADDLHERLMHMPPYPSPKGVFPIECPGSPGNCSWSPCKCEEGETPKYRIGFRVYDLEDREIKYWEVSDGTMDTILEEGELREIEKSVFRVRLSQQRYHLSFVGDADDVLEDEDWDILEAEYNKNKPMRDYYGG